MAKKDTAATKQARVLGEFTLDGIEYKPNDVIESTPELIASLGSLVDANPEAVAHCLDNEGASIRKHVTTEQEV